MRILSKVSAKFFHPKDASVTYMIGPHDLLVLRDAPDWIADTMLYKWMLADGTIEVVNLTATQKQLENDPVQGAYADGTKRLAEDVDSEALDEAETASDVEADKSTDTDAKKPARGRKPKSVEAGVGLL